MDWAVELCETKVWVIVLHEFGSSMALAPLTQQNLTKQKKTLERDVRGNKPTISKCSFTIIELMDNWLYFSQQKKMGLVEAPGFQKTVWEIIAAQLMFFKICILNLFNTNKKKCFSFLPKHSLCISTFVHPRNTNRRWSNSLKQHSTRYPKGKKLVLNKDYVVARASFSYGYII